MIALRSFALLMFCLSTLSFSAWSFSAEAQNMDSAPNNILGNINENGAEQSAAQNYNNTDNNQAISSVNNPDRQRPVPKRLTAQERWNRMSVEQRSIIINEWQKLDETVRPVFPIYRDNALEQQLQQAAGGNAIAPVTSPVSMPVPAPAATTMSDDDAAQETDAGQNLAPTPISAPTHSPASAPTGN